MEKDEFKEQLAKQLDEKFPNFEKHWGNIVNSLGNEFVELIRERFKNEIQPFESISNFRFSVVIDNNFILGQIKNAVEKNIEIKHTFIYRLVNSNYIDVYGPYKLREELFIKIKNVLKVKNELAVEYANLLIKNIIIKDAYWVDEWKKANNLIGHIDEDDVPYLALAIHINSHAIISKDKIFHKQGASKAWKINDLDKIITSYNSGFISFCFLSTGVNILELVWKIIFSIFKVIGEILFELISSIGVLLDKSIQLILKNIPNELIYFFSSILVGVSLFSEDFRNYAKDIFKRIGDFTKKAINKIKGFINWLINLIKELWEIYKPIGITGLELAGYFSLELQIMMEQIEKLDKERAK